MPDRVPGPRRVESHVAVPPHRSTTVSPATVTAGPRQTRAFAELRLEPRRSARKPRAAGPSICMTYWFLAASAALNAREEARGRG